MRATYLVFAVSALSLAGCDGCSKEAPPPETTKTPEPEPAAPTTRPVTREFKRASPTLAPVPETPLTKEDVASCDTATDILKKLGCIGSLAQRHRDPRYCDEIERQSQNAPEDAPDVVRSGTAASACRRTIAYMRDDPELCAKIPQPAMAASCLSYFAMKRREPAVCDLGGKGSEASMMCYLNEAARTRDPSLCQQTGKFREDCTKRLGPLKE